MTIKPDYDSIPRSYRDYLELMQREGEFVAIDQKTRALEPRKYNHQTLEG
jgi:hypothetical protein